MLYLNRSECQPLWGFSSFIQTADKNILFDTGSNGRVLIKNMKTKGINISDIDTIFISHGHWDHIGGIDSIIELNNNIDIVVSTHVSKNFVNDYKKLSKSITVVNDNITQIAPNIYSSGSLGDTKEQSLILDTKSGLIIIFGCAHSGVGKVSKMIHSHFKKDILLIMGGFHLSNKSDLEIFKLINTFKKIGTKYIIPSHCTGESANKIFLQHYKQNFIKGGVGMEISFDENAKLVIN